MPYRAGIIGTGGVGGLGFIGMHDPDTVGSEPIDASHAGGYRRTDAIELVAAADIDEDQLATFGEVYAVPEERRYADHRTMLEAEDLDIVSVCTPTYLHHEHVIDAARIADPAAIWAEKPIASSVSDAEAAIGACEDTDTELVINHTSRFTGNMRRLREHVREDLLGEVLSATAIFRMELLRNSTHLLDTLVYLLDARAERVSGYLTGENEALDAIGTDAEVDDSGGGGYVVLDDGTFVTVDCTVPRDVSTYAYHLVGTEGKLYVNINDGEWRYWDLGADGHVEGDLPGIEPDPDEYAKGFANAADHLAALIGGDAENRSPGREALRSLEIIVGFYVSEYTGGHVDVPLDRPLRDVTIRSW